jgi:hypothetical protein
LILEAIIERVWTSTLQKSMDVALGAMMLFISLLSRKLGTVTRWISLSAPGEIWVDGDRLGCEARHQPKLPSGVN